MKIVKEVVFWVIALFVALVCLRSGLMKMPGVPGEQFWIRDFQRCGYPDWFRIVVGAAELNAFAPLLVPRFAAYGAAVFAAIMLGAIFNHATHNKWHRLNPVRCRDIFQSFQSESCPRDNRVRSIGEPPLREFGKCFCKNSRILTKKLVA